ncbi:MAG: polyphosphate kinase 1 [Longimicrobiales bacterium]|nr:polyphosphate kinase 1 [Longimicrobiales bacterium]
MLGITVPEPGVLERVASAPRPLGMRSGRAAYALLRETYFDTRDGALEDRTLALCLRLEASGRQTLELRRKASVTLSGVEEVEIFSTPVLKGGFYATLSGDSELATLIREVADPSALRPFLALDIDREILDQKAGWFGKPVCEVRFDRILAHRQGATRALFEIVMTEPAAGASTLDPLAQHLNRVHGLAHDGMSTVQRARAALGGQVAFRPEAPREVRMSLLLRREGAVALVAAPTGLTLPAARGSGEELAAAAARDFLGTFDAPNEPELVGFAPSRGGGADLEVWLCDCPPGPGGPQDALWFPVVELLARVGGPGLRDPALVATLLLLVRSETGQRLLSAIPFPRGAPTLVVPGPRRPEMPPGDDPEDFLDVVLSILEFNQRVLEMAEDPAVPLIERFRFLSIFASNMDEFFVVRVGRLKGEHTGVQPSDDIDLTTTELLDLIAVRVRALVARHYACLHQALLPALAAKGTRLRTWIELAPDARARLTERFEAEIFPLLTPQAMAGSPGQPFPRLESLGLSLAAVLRGTQEGIVHLAHVPVPHDLPRFVAVPGSRDLIALEEIIAANAATLFPAFQVADVHSFRISRMGDVEIDEGASASLLSAVEDEVEARPFKPVVRIEVQRSMPREILAYLLRELRQERGSESTLLGRGDVFEVDGPLDLRSFAELGDMGLDGETYEPFAPVQPWPSDRSVFELLREGERLVYHPFESFDGSVGRFLSEASTDPDVLAIKLTLYRTGRTSPFADALLEALRRGKEVTVFVELKARFDEESNIQWTRRLIEAGGHVVYGVVGFKTHAKTALVVRREGDGIRRYVHIGTGNYNAATAHFYTDLGLLSADPDLGADLNDFFNELTGSAGPPVKSYRRLLVAPASLAQGLEALVEREKANALAGRPAGIQAKLNGLTDRRVVRALYDAAAHGVPVDLVVRAVCTLRPGVPGLSEGIRVRSILGRFLEHARIYYFENGGAGDYYLASADWRKRNLRKRVEVAVPVDDPRARARLRSILDAELADPRAWVLRPDGSYERLAGRGKPAQERFLADLP